MVSTKKFKGFTFAKIGKFNLCKKPYKMRGQGRNWDNPTGIELLVSDNILNAGSTAYLVMLGSQYEKENILYVGEYSNSLRQRWFRHHKEADTWISWHSDNLDDNLNFLMCTLNDVHTSRTDYVSTKSNKDSIKSDVQTILDRVNNSGQEQELSLWLACDPYCKVADNELSINISRSIEQLFLQDKDLLLPLNSKGRTIQPEAVKPVAELLKLS